MSIKLLDLGVKKVNFNNFINLNFEIFYQKIYNIF